MKIVTTLTIKEDTTLGDLQRFANMDDTLLTRLIDKLPDMAAPFDFWALSVGDFCKLSDNRITEVFPELLDDSTRVFRAVNIMRHVRKSFSDFEALLGRYQISDGVKNAVEFSTEEAMLLSLVKYYHLHGLEEAQRLTLYEYVLMVKDNWNEYQIQKREMAKHGAGRRHANGSR